MSDIPTVRELAMVLTTQLSAPLFPLASLRQLHGLFSWPDAESVCDRKTLAAPEG